MLWGKHYLLQEKARDILFFFQYHCFLVLIMEISDTFYNRFFIFCICTAFLYTVKCFSVFQSFDFKFCISFFPRLLGKVALVTGGASGIGESIVRLFLRHGAKVCIADLQDNLGKQVCKSLGDEANVNFVHCDVTVENDVSNAVDSTVGKFDTLDIMVNNAGISGAPCPDIRNVDMSEFDKVFNINVKGVFHGMKHAARFMIPKKTGSIVSLSSVASTMGGMGPHAYTGSKHAVWGLTKNVATELGFHGIRVNCVSPYCVATGLALAHLPEEERTEDAIAGFRAFVGRNANLQGVELTSGDVANAVLFLASDDARYISGENLMIDGGFTRANHLLRVFR